MKLQARRREPCGAAGDRRRRGRAREERAAVLRGSELRERLLRAEERRGEPERGAREGEERPGPPRKRLGVREEREHTPERGESEDEPDMTTRRDLRRDRLACEAERGRGEHQSHRGGWDRPVLPRNERLRARDQGDAARGCRTYSSPRSIVHRSSPKHLSCVRVPDFSPDTTRHAIVSEPRERHRLGMICPSSSAITARHTGCDLVGT